MKTELNSKKKKKIVHPSNRSNICRHEPSVCYPCVGTDTGPPESDAAAAVVVHHCEQQGSLSNASCGVVQLPDRRWQTSDNK